MFSHSLIHFIHVFRGVPRQNRRAPWAYDRQRYKQRNEVERLFRRLKGFCQIFTCFEKLDVLFLRCIVFSLIVEALR